MYIYMSGHVSEQKERETHTHAYREFMFMYEVTSNVNVYSEEVTVYRR